jgi:haloacetate dehalogenase
MRRMDLLAGFEAHDVMNGNVRLRAYVGGAVGGAGAPLLLLHGHPQTSAMWHRVAPALAERHRVVAMDLRGYGDSERIAADPAHAGHGKRAMAADALAVMRALGHQRFQVLAHDRGARVAHRLALDHPQAVTRLMLLDIAPTLAMYEHTSEAFAREYWHWFFLIQPAPLPERLIAADPRAYVREVMGRRPGGLALFDPAALAQYERCIAIAGSASAVCEDYRAAAGVDLDQHRADQAAGRKLALPLRVLWGARGTVGRLFDPIALWRDVVLEPEQHLSGRALDCGHYIAEEAPAALLAEARSFFQEQT